MEQHHRLGGVAEVLQVLQDLLIGHAGLFAEPVQRGFGRAGLRSFSMSS